MLDGDIVGDHYNCVCPHCGKCNNYITQGVELTLGTIKTFSKDCHYCKREVFYRAEYVIQVTASTEHPIDRLR
jgi:hypothetical protein